MTLTFKVELEVIQIQPYTKFRDPSSYIAGDMNYFLVNFGQVNFGQVTDRRTDRQTDRQTESDAYEPTVHLHRCAQKSEGAQYLRIAQNPPDLNKLLTSGSADLNPNLDLYLPTIGLAVFTRHRQSLIFRLFWNAFPPWKFHGVY